MTKIKLAWTATTAAAALALLGATAPAPALADGGTHAPALTTGVLFNDPTSSDPARSDAIPTHLARLIDGAVPGSDIKISTYVFGSRWVVQRLNAAHLRGVNVQVLLDSETRRHWEGGPTYDLLAAGLAKKPAGSGDSWVRLCADKQACLAKDPSPTDGWPGVNHNKFYLFSRTTGSAGATVPVDDVVVQSSANMTTWDRLKSWNDALTVAGNPALYGAYAAYFGRQAEAQADPSKQVSDVLMDTQAGRAKAYFFPRATTDVIVNILSMVDKPVDGRPVCQGNDPGYGTTDGRTVIRVAMHGITRPQVAQKLWELDDAGCYVDVVYRDLEASVEQILTTPTRYGGVATHKLDDAAGGTDTATHTKYLLVEGTYKGVKNQKIVFTGSHPYTKSALVGNDEALLKWDDSTGPGHPTASVYDAYRENFRTQRAVSDAQNALP
ncbi:phospholipase D-like domain-containing protein [Streptomyces sp. SP18CS02]|uniref:phospholipase D-like domain-containing protein n=1 Tax=Streptomyces sp. SP18CS02 TaxID=3002531 RepID=UPI002E79FF12|nr:phospholipase D-like domain-containing protein [Streptomyces sp. SP18CS02]MEE1752808.1 phospholipase D-like domain-containing protein [Streptomyces sp. SP18CS02]